MNRQPARRTFLALAAASGAAAVLAACSGPAASPGTGTNHASSTGADALINLDSNRTLVVFFSVPETDNPENMTPAEENSTHVVNGEVLGNTQYVAQLIAAGIGANTFRIETAEELPLTHSVLEDLAKDWQDSGARPPLASQIPNLGEYDTVFVGYPIWWYDLPMPMHTFFAENDLTGKTVIPFNTHGGSRLSGTVEVITELLPGATVNTNALTITHTDMDSAPTEVDAWLKTLVAE
ncbi:flavodoxin [Pseudarthrobacter sp. NPDC058329]|uniref:flavodoxin n=1 Tax=Pseudarthrobacter sp. NPDC058329 TaxID=3346448 RepID=UPI0036D93A16